MPTPAVPHPTPWLPTALIGLVACSACPKEPTFERTEPLQSVYDDFMAWTGSDGLCIDAVNLEPPVGLRDGDAREIGVSDGPSAATELRRGLCVALDRQTGVSGCGGTCETSFADACQLGPPLWAQAALQACGETGLNTQQQFIADEVYPHYPGLPDDQHLHRELGPATVIPDGFLLGSRHEFASVGDGLYRMQYTYDDHRDVVAFIDRLNLDGTIDAVSTHLGLFPMMDGGDALVVWDQSWPQGQHTSTLDEVGVGRVHTVTPGLRVDHGVVSEGVWYAPQIEWVADQPMVAADLTTGNLSILPLPLVPEGFTPLFGRPVATPGGFVVLVSHAVVNQRESDWLEIYIADVALERYEAATKRWTRLMQGARFYPTGTTSDGIVMGTLSEGQQVLAGYDLNTERFRVSHDICLQTNPVPWVIDGKAWYVDLPDEPGDADLVMKPLR